MKVIENIKEEIEEKVRKCEALWYFVHSLCVGVLTSHMMCVLRCVYLQMAEFIFPMLLLMDNQIYIT